MRHFFKKLGCLLLTTALLTISLVPCTALDTEAASAQTISKALKSKTYKSVPQYTKSSLYLPDLNTFTDYSIELRNRDRPDDSRTTLWESWELAPETAQSIAEEYVSLLQDKRFHLEVVWKKIESNIFRYEFRYTGKGKASVISGDNDEQTYHVVVTYQAYNKGNHTIHIGYSSQFQVIDTLDRMGGSSVKNETIKGTSARKAIIKTADGSYRTSDQRLSIKTGYADILVNGKHFRKKASFSSETTRAGEYTYDFIQIGNVWENNDMEIQFIHDSPTSGALYNKADVMFYNRWQRLYFQIENTETGEFYGPSSFDYITLRTAKWDKNGVSVIYFAARYKDDNNKTCTIEGLTAAKYKDPLASQGESLTVKKGKTLSVQFNDVEFVPNYELYRWEVISGADIVSLSGTKSRTCKIKGKKKGNAVIRITYEYGKDEPDVLTGIDRNVNRTKTKLYRIKVI